MKIIVWVLLGIIFLTGVLLFGKRLQESPPLTVGPTTDLGTISQPGSITTRDGGAGAAIGGKYLWTFADTLVKNNPNPAEFRSASAGYAPFNSPTTVNDLLNSKGVPFQLIPYTQKEIEYNMSANNPAERIALWPTSVVPHEGKAIIYYLKLKVHPGYLNYDLLGTGVAILSDNDTVATRQGDVTFETPEPLFGDAALMVGKMIYTYDCTNSNGLDAKCKLARVNPADVADRTKYEYWDGKAWSDDINATAIVLSGPYSEFSVGYNRYLKRYLAVYSKGLSNDVLARTAPKPEGPWSKPITLFSAQPPVGDTVNYGARWHPGLSTNDQDLYISYYRPIGFLQGEIRLVKTRLND